MTVLYLIVARGGSKRVPGKNLRQINGISLVGYKAKAAWLSKFCSGCIISTDSLEIATEAAKHGVRAPFIRPENLATDTTTTEDVVRHAIAQCLQSHPLMRYDAIMLLEPSSPFVRPSDYDMAVDIMVKTKCQFVFGEVIYLFRWDYLEKRVDLFDTPDRMEYMVLPAGQAIDIDTMADLKHAEFLAANKLVDLSWATP